MALYDIVDHDGDILARNLSLTDAADAVMTSDGREWELRNLAPHWHWEAWSRHQVANRPWEATRFLSYERIKENAKLEICQQIVSAERMRGHCEAILAGSYDELDTGE